MGDSDRHYFGWLRDTLQQAEASTGVLAGMRAERGRRTMWVLAGVRPNPAIDFLADALGRATTTVRYLDRYATEPEVLRADFNALDALPADSCDVLVMTRASYMIEDPARFLRGTRRLMRPGGVAVIDWVHGAANTPVLDLPGSHVYDGRAHPFRTTYVDDVFLAECREEFSRFIRDLNRPPGLARRLRRIFGAMPGRSITSATYVDDLRHDLSGAGKRLIEPSTLEEFFKVAFRAARYFRPSTGKFYLHLLTVLRPVGK